MTTTRNISINLLPASFITVPMWIVGCVLAQGFWSTFFAVLFPPWGIYLTAEKLLMYFGII
jgi:hypothetical protein